MKTKLLITLVIIIVACVIFFTPAHTCTVFNADQNHTIRDFQIKSDSIKYKVFKTASGWGYDIYISNTLCIHQPNIPATSGNNGFSKKKFAVKTATLVIDKISRNIFPPTVTVGELDSLKVLK